MANITKTPRAGNSVGSTPWGDVRSLSYNLTTKANGSPVDADSTVAIAIADVVRLGVIPAGSKLLDMIATVSDAFTASTTCKIGFAYVDGVDSTKVPQDDDYFAATATALSSAAVLRKATTTAPVTLPKDAYLTLTWEGANNAAVGILDVVLLVGSEGAA